MAHPCRLVRSLEIVQTAQNNRYDLWRNRGSFSSICACTIMLKLERQHSYIVYFPAVVPAQSVMQVQRVRTVQDCWNNWSSGAWLRPKLCMKHWYRRRIETNRGTEIYPTLHRVGSAVPLKKSVDEYPPQTEKLFPFNDTHAAITVILNVSPGLELGCGFLCWGFPSVG